MGDITVKFEGFKQIERALNKLPDSVERKVTRSVLNKAATPLQRSTGSELASRLASSTADDDRRTGNAIASLKGAKAKVTRKYEQGRLHVHVSGAYPIGAHLHLLEWGTVKFKGWGFMRSAWDTSINTVFAKVRQGYAVGIPKELERLAKKK
ncbi:MAG: hypothetical protein DHS20C16_03530 [Phycisphaerae bacterium]|nr:MAG: hypothetical protein DHS20C16_03530 [Phycisphaerae bacterium]